MAIIGAGMGGLTCALSLAKQGFENIEVYESASNLGFVGAGIHFGDDDVKYFISSLSGVGGSL